MNVHATRSTIRSRRIVRAVAITTVATLGAACSDNLTRPETVDSPPLPAVAAAVSSALEGCTTGVQPDGALYEICVPPVWNGDVITWAHGYQDPEPTPVLPDDEVEGIPIKNIVLGLHYAYAATSYQHTGLVADVGADALDELPAIVRTVTGAEPGHFFLVGASEGSLSSILSLQRSGTPFDGGLAVCGPLGSFRAQINWFGDFRAVFDYFFPGVLPGSPISVPASLADNWDTYYVGAIEAALAGAPGKTSQLLSVTRAPVDPGDPATVAETVVDILRYNAFATNDAVTRLSGNPYDNSHKWYSGSHNDLRLNLRIHRYHASATALANLASFETSGVLRRPTVALHTTGDPVVPAWQLSLYQIKTLLAGSAFQLSAFPVSAYGHCNFTESQVLAGFALLVLRVTFRDLITSAAVFPNESVAQDFLARARQQGASPRVIPERDLAAAMLRR